MKLEEIIDVTYHYGVLVDVYTSDSCHFHKTLYEGFSEDCPRDLLGNDVTGLYDYEDGICIAIATDTEE